MRSFLVGLPGRYNLQKNLHITEELKQEISAAVISVSEETLIALVRNFRRQLQMVLEADDAHTENVYAILTRPKLLKYSDICYVVRYLYKIRSETSFKKDPVLLECRLLKNSTPEISAVHTAYHVYEYI
jgi:hypothetical protein